MFDAPYARITKSCNHDTTQHGRVEETNPRVKTRGASATTNVNCSPIYSGGMYANLQQIDCYITPLQ